MAAFGRSATTQGGASATMTLHNDSVTLHIDSVTLHNDSVILKRVSFSLHHHRRLQ
jgi:hypothetical protein